MGCVTSKEGLGFEEEHIVQLESQLEYYKNSSVVIDSTHRKYSSDYWINPDQWSDIKSFLQIRTNNSPNCSKIEEFFSSFKENDKLPLRKMSILGIFLGHGLPRQKSRLLFEIFDNQCTETITKEVFQLMLDEIFDVCINKLLILAEIDVRLHKMRLIKGFCIGKITLTLKFFNEQDELSMKDFILQFEGENGKLLHPHGFRDFCLKMHSTN